MHLLQCFGEPVHDPPVDSTVSLLDSSLDNRHNQVVRHEFTFLDGLGDDDSSLSFL